MASIYLSYNANDREFATALAHRLRQAGHDVAIDIDTIMPGSDWREELGRALKKSEVFIALITENSQGSHFVSSELGAAMAYSGSASGMLVLPIVIGNIGIPPFIQHINALRSPHPDPDLISAQVEEVIVRFSGKKAAQEKSQSEIQKRIEKNAADYIDDAMKRLCETEARGRTAGLAWYIFGYLSLLGGVAFAGYSLTHFATPAASTDWTIPALLALKSVLVVGMLIASSKYCFILGRAHSAEAHKNSDRSHAISFGKFYLQVFGANADWAQLKEVFQHWNIDKGSNFSTLDSESYDPRFAQAVKELASALASVRDTAKTEK